MVNKNDTKPVNSTNNAQNEAKILTQYTQEDIKRFKKWQKQSSFNDFMHKYFPSWLSFLFYIVSIILIFWFSLNGVINLVAADKYIHREMIEESVIELVHYTDLGNGKYDISFTLNDITNKFGTNDFHLKLSKNVGITLYGSRIILKDVKFLSGENKESYMVVTDGGPSLFYGLLKKVHITLFIFK